MLYAIVATDVADSADLRSRTRSLHLDYVRVLQDEGRLILAGPNPAIDSIDPGPAGNTGSLIVAEFESLAEAESWAEQDPYNEAGVFAEVVVKPFVQVMP